MRQPTEKNKLCICALCFKDDDEDDKFRSGTSSNAYRYSSSGFQYPDIRGTFEKIYDFYYNQSTIWAISYWLFWIIHIWDSLIVDPLYFLNSPFVKTWVLWVCVISYLAPITIFVITTVFKSEPKDCRKKSSFLILKLCRHEHVLAKRLNANEAFYDNGEK